MQTVIESFFSFHAFFSFSHNVKEPFTSLHIDLHDGFFDHGSRLFSSIPRAWENCQRDPSDVKVCLTYECSVF